MAQHVFRWKGQTLRMEYSFTDERDVQHLVLDDVWAATAEAANSVPDWKIEYEACAVAESFGGRYI